jgi:hypothetical protein
LGLGAVERALGIMDKLWIVAMAFVSNAIVHYKGGRENKNDESDVHLLRR